MATGIRQLISQTAIYGITNMVGRFLNFLLVPLYTAILLPESFAVITVFYALAGFVNVLLSFGMETTYFNFCREHDEQKVFANAMSWVGALALVFALVFGFFPSLISNLVGFPEHSEIARWLVFILLADALAVIPFARLRQKNKALKFGAIKLSNIGINIGLNLFFLWLCPYVIENGVSLDWYQSDKAVNYVFISNLAASLVTLVLVIPGLSLKRSLLDKRLIKTMFTYALPLVVVGFAGMINELIDRILLQRLLPEDRADFETGVYGAFYRLSIIITIFIQAFRFAAEPFFLRNRKMRMPNRLMPKS
jgi:O-antigen/teichoic acid export membrane protein